MNRKIKGIVSARLFLDLLKMIFIGLIMFAAVFYVRDYISARLADTMIGRICVIALPMCAGAVVYAGLSLLARIPEAMTVMGILKKYVRKG